MRKILVVTALVLVVSLSACGSKGAPATGFAGSWSVDNGALLQSMMAMVASQMPAEMPAEARAAAEAQMKAAAEKMKVDLVLKPDNTWTVTYTTPSENGTAGGTWAEAEGGIKFVTTHEDGAAKETPEEMMGTFKDGGLHIKPEADMPFDFVLRKN